jgi:hypothetical protein
MAAHAEMFASRAWAPLAFAVLHRTIIAAFAVVLALLCAASLRWPFSWDHGIFAWIGDTIVKGGIPYRDAWDVKGPLTFYVFAGVEAVLGKPMWAIRVFDLLVLLLTAVIAGRLARKLGGPGAGSLAALLLSIQYLGSGYFETAQPEGWAGFLLLMSFAPFARNENATTARDVIISSVLLGTCLLFKPTFAVLVVVPVAYVLLAPDLGVSAKLRTGALAITMFLVPTALCIAWFAWRGGLGSLIDTYVRFNLVQSSIPVPGVDSSFHGAAHRFAWRIYSNPVTVCGGLLALIALQRLRRNRPRLAWVLAIGLAASFFCVFVQERYWNRYQWHPPYMLLTLLAAVGLGRMWHDGSDTRWRTVGHVGAVGLGAVLLIAMMPQPVNEVHRWLQLQLGIISNEQYDAVFVHESSTIKSSRNVAAFVRAHTEPSDRVLAWSDPLVNYLSDRKPPGRFAFHVALNAPIVTPFHQRYRAEFLRDFTRHPPRAFAIGLQDLDETGPLRPPNIGHQFPELRDRLLNEYRPVARFDQIQVYERTAQELPNLRIRNDSGFGESPTMGRRHS